MKHTRPFSILFLLLFIGAFGSPVRAVNEVGPDNRYYLVHDFSYDWLVYSPQYKNFVPYSKGLNESDLSVSLLVDLLKNRRYDLLITSSRENYLFIEGALQKKIEPDTWLTLKVDSLYRVYGKEELLITLYGSAGIEFKTVLLGHAKKIVYTAAQPESKTISLINIKPIETSAFNDFSIVLILFLLLLALFAYSSTPSIFRRFLSLNDFVDVSERNDLYRFSRPYTRVMLFNALIVSASMGYLVLYVTNIEPDLLDTRGFLSEGDKFYGILLDEIKLTFIFISLFFLKYILMGIVAGVLNIERVVNTHYIKALQVSFVFYGLVTLTFFALSLHQPTWLQSTLPYLLYFFIFYYLLRFGLMYIFTNNSGQLINLYLFSYLCVIELIPLIIGVKFAI